MPSRASSLSSGMDMDRIDLEEDGEAEKDEEIPKKDPKGKGKEKATSVSRRLLITDSTF